MFKAYNVSYTFHSVAGRSDLTEVGNLFNMFINRFAEMGWTASASGSYGATGHETLWLGVVHSTGVKIILAYTIEGGWPFKTTLLVHADRQPSGLSLMYIPPSIATNISWPTSSNYSTWEPGYNLKFISLASAATNYASAVTLPRNDVRENYYFLTYEDTMGIFHTLTTTDGTYVYPYWPQQRMEGAFFGKIFGELANESDTCKYGAFCLQPDTPRDETTMPNGLGFWLASKPNTYTDQYQTDTCPFYYFDASNQFVTNARYSYDFNCVRGMSTTGTRFMPMAVGSYNSIASGNDMKGWLDTALFKFVNYSIPSGTLLKDDEICVVGGGLAIAWDPENINFLALGRPTSYSNNMGIISPASVQNYNPSFELSIIDEQGGDDDDEFTTTGDAGAGWAP